MSKVVLRRLAIGACLTVSGLALTVHPASAQITDQQVADQSVAPADDATVSFSVPAAPNLSWIAPRKTPRARFDAAPMAARQSTDSGVGFGALVGFVRTSASGEADDVEFEFKGDQGWMAGIWFGGNRDGVVGFMGELSYVVKKVKSLEGSGAPSAEIGYIEIPALLRINIGQRSASGIRFYGIVGPVFDIKVTDNANDFGFDDDAFESFDVGLLGGAGIEVLRFAFEVRGNWGLRQVISANVASAVFENTDIKAFTLQIVCKFRFN